MKQIVKIKLPKQQVEEMKSSYEIFLLPNDGEYVLWYADLGDLQITAYFSKKPTYSVLFSGKGALNEAKRWDPNAALLKFKAKEKEEWICLDNQIGSDEVGTGDFLLPMVVCASFIRKKDIKTLIEFGVHDSKKLTDEQILDLGEKLSSKVFISTLICPNEKYNEMYLKGEHIESMKAKMHNRALLNMLKQFPDCKNIFVDQFAAEKTYYNYLNNPNEPRVMNITFKTKGELSYPSVALASVMARYAFLKEKKKLEEHYKMVIELGSGLKADECAKSFVKKYGIKELEKICKKNFANYKALTEIKLV